MKVSVIIPVYNSEKHLRQCLDSVLSQSLQDIEVICVDDGSTDSSPEILEEYAERDARLTVINQENSYAGTARNNGLKAARGEYVIFWDSDDFFEAQALEKMYERAVETEADVCVCGINKFYEDSGELTASPAGLIISMTEGQEVFNRLSNEKHIFNFTVIKCINKLVRRQFIEKQDLRFGTGRYGEDVIFTCGALATAERITFVNENLVNYRAEQSDSLVGNVRNYIRDAVDSWRQCACFLKEKDAFPEQSFENRMIIALMHDLRNTRERESFVKAVRYIKEECLKDLSLKKREEGYYYSDATTTIAEHLLEDEPEAFHDFLFYYQYTQTIHLRERLKNAQAENGRQTQRLKRLNEKLDSSGEALAAQKKKTKKLTRILKRERSRISSLEEQLQERDEQLAKAQEELASARRKLTKLKKSFSYRLGQLLTWLPRKIVGLLASGKKK
ncbi:MAG: glycosyltransferase [Erysipelotrichaceae bacterium]|nr:glycosyltransferase [Erysipelotrichaceae bacterium]